MALAAVTLNDKYTVERGRIFLTGTQALVRLPMMQRARDVAAGLNTACFISGYRGSPLGGFDQGLWSAQRFLDENHITFQPGVNEDLGATAVWGSQQVGLFSGAKYDGVFAMWYGKGPGVDRSGDVFKHGNAAGTAPKGGVLLLAGDDHACKSSTLPHQSEYAFMDASIPVLNPAGVQDILDFGLYGWAMSRYSGCWIALKTIAETVDSSASVFVDPARVGLVFPTDFEMPPGGLNIRWPDAPLEQEFRLHKYKLYAALAFARANKFDENREWIMPSTGELTPAQIARVIAQRIGRFYTSPRIEDRLKFLEAKEQQLATHAVKIERTPHFCSGCPHNTSTKVPEGSRAVAGIGCHYMAVWMDRATETFTQMGGEGVPWIGQAPFTETKHIFANLGDGTYFHSGILAIRAAIASGVNITYKILYNDAVAMTGGQPVDGQLSVQQIAHQLAAEGVRRIVVVSDEPDKYGGTGFPTDVDIHHRDKLDEVQRDLREIAGCTILIYDQTCAAEKRRRRKRGKYPDPPKRVFINEAVCEGCGDCSTQSNCLSVVPVETEFGRKRAIDQSSCNKDYSCVNGFCPSFVTVHGGSLRKPERKQADASRVAEPPEPVLPAIGEPYGILVTGVGGTGVVTIGALLGMAAHIEGKGVSVLDMTGLAQKGGAVFSHVRIANRPEDIHAVRIAAGDADLLIGCDIVVAASPDGLSKLRKGKSSAVVNAHETITGAFTRNPDFVFPSGDLRSQIVEATGAESADFIDATRIATALLGDSIATNLFMLGFAYQKGLVPVSGAAIDRAIELNGVAIAFNREAFLWGRLAAHRRAEVEREAAPREPVAAEALSSSIDEAVSRRVAFLTRYQNAAYAVRYERLVRNVETAERTKARGQTGLADAVARSFFKLMAYKDEYEVARLYTDGEFEKQLRSQFEGDFRLEFHLAPPLLAERDQRTGHLKKRAYGAWMMGAFAVLAKLKMLRGTTLDVFGYSAERRTERRLIGEYETLVDELVAGLTPENHAFAVALARLPEHIRGYGHIKEANLAAAEAEEARLIALFRAPPPQSAIAAE